jgi:hypothetical protein
VGFGLMAEALEHSTHSTRCRLLRAGARTLAHAMESPADEALRSAGAPSRLIMPKGISQGKPPGKSLG